MKSLSLVHNVTSILPNLQLNFEKLSCAVLCSHMFFDRDALLSVLEPARLNWAVPVWLVIVVFHSTNPLL